jgi:putative membrane protein insertion efficiency factor
MSSTIDASVVGLAADAPVGSYPSAPGLVARLLVTCIRGYQLLRVGRVSPCRFTPTCSHYAVDAVSRHGGRRGLGLTIRRLGRCRPGGPSGFDPVPEHPSSRTPSPE